MFVDIQTPHTDRLASEFRNTINFYVERFSTQDMSQWPRHAQRRVSWLESDLIGSRRRETRGQLS